MLSPPWGPHRGAENTTAQRGSAIAIALIFTVIVVGIVVTGTLTLRTHNTRTRISFEANNQAVSASLSGLNEALSWCRRQTSQPVTEFAPERDEGASPPVLDTDEPDIGLVREFRISGNLWARYEVWKAWNTDPDPARLAWRRQFECEDVSAERGTGSDGSSWRLKSLGYVFRQLDPDVPFNEQPNEVLASELSVAELRRIVINLPGAAAINVGDGNSCHINTNGRIVGGGAGGIYYPAGTGTPTTGPVGDARVTGSPALATAPGAYDDSVEAVFGLTFAELSSMATAVVTSAAEFPQPLPDNGLVVVDVPNLDIDAPGLTGTSIVVVRGNVVLNSGNNSLFNGLLYVDGNLTIRAPSEINGSVVCTGNLTVQGMPDYATIQFDADVLQSLMRNFGNYRFAGGVLLPRRGR